MGIVLTLLDDVRWRGVPVVGERPRALLAALAAGKGRPVRSEELVELVWRDEIPANATKSLQVLVSRTRSACGEDVIVRDAMWLRSRLLGSFSISCVMVPWEMKGARFWGIRGVPPVAAVWLGKEIALPGEPVVKGVMLTAGMVGFPARTDDVP